MPFAAASGHHNVVFTATVGSLVTTNVRLFAQGPAITSFEPATAATGDKVTLRGEGLASAHTHVTVSNKDFAISPNGTSADAIAVTVPANATAGTFAVTNLFGSGFASGIFVPFSKLCKAAYTTPTYVPPTDDAAALESLAEASGYAGSNNSDWVGAGAGNLCGGSEKELVLMKNKHSYFSVLRGPTPNVISAADLISTDTDPWRAIAVGNLDKPSPKPEPGEFDPNYAEIVAVRKVADDGTADLVVARAGAESCEPSSVIATAKIGGASNSNWVGAAIGDFDKGATVALGTKEIALLRNGSPAFEFVKFQAGSFPEFGELHTFHEDDLDTDASLPWKGLAAGDVDGDGIDEVVAVRQVADGHSATVLVYKWNGDGFTQFASSTIGSSGDSNWAGVTVGDFNADGRASIVLAKDTQPNFIVLTFPVGGSGTLTQIATSNLDSVQGQEWRAVVATDWLSDNDRSAAELIAVRHAHTDESTSPPQQYRTDLFVYGDDFHRISRDTGLVDTKAQAYYLNRPDGSFPPFELPWSDARLDELIAALRDTHTNTYHWLLQYTEDYDWLVKFLKRTYSTRDGCIDGRQLRVRVTLTPASYVSPDPDQPPPENCAWPTNSPDTPWNERDFFGDKFLTPQVCSDFVDWGAALGRLAQAYPQLDAVGVDDFSLRMEPLGAPDTKTDPAKMTDEQVAAFQAGLRSKAPWVNFVPTVYHDWAGGGHQGGRFIGADLPDIGRAWDSMVFFFRNEKYGACPLQPPACTYGAPVSAGCHADGITGCTASNPCSDAERVVCQSGCLAGTCGESAIPNVSDELCDMKSVLAAGRKFELGIYVAAHAGLGTPSARYDYDLGRLALTHGWLGLNGVTLYMTQSKDPSQTCTTTNYLDSDLVNLDADSSNNVTKYCMVKRLFEGGDTTTVSHIDLTAASCGSVTPPIGDPVGYASSAEGVQNVVYRGGADVHRISFTDSTISHVNFNHVTNSGVATASSDPTAYVFDPFGDTNQLFHNVLYQSADRHIHTAQWEGQLPLLLDGYDLTSNADAPAVASGSRPFGFVINTGPELKPFRQQNVLYRAEDDSLHRLWTSDHAFGSVWDEDLSGRAGSPSIDGNPFGYTFSGTQTAVYRAKDTHHLYELSWTGISGQPQVRNYTTDFGAPACKGNPTAYVAAAFSTQNVVYRSDQDELILASSQNTLGNVSVTDLTSAAGAPAAAGDPSAYFVDGDQTHHVFYTAVDGRLYELRWTVPTYPGAVTIHDLAPTRQAPPALGNPSAYYYDVNKTHHVLYRAADNHVHELEWGGTATASGQPTIK